MNQFKSSPKFLLSLASIALTLAGVAGLAYRIFSPGGWLTNAFGQIWTLEMHYLVMGLPVAIGGVVLFKHVSAEARASDLLGTVLMYLLMAYGLYTIVEFKGFNLLLRP